MLDDLYGETVSGGVQVMAVGRDSSELRSMEAPPAFPVLVDPGRVHSSYGVGEVLPTTYVLDAERRVSDVVQGGGQSVSKLITRIASRELARDPERARRLWQVSEELTGVRYLGARA